MFVYYQKSKLINMLKRVTLPFLFALFSLVCFNRADAAFPTEKNSEKVVVAPVAKSNDNDASTQTLSKREVKKEAKEFVQKSASSSGGKSKIVAALLAFFLGDFGVHSFYMGQTKKGAIQAGLTGLGLLLIIVGIASTASVGGLGATAGVGVLLIVGVGIWAFVDFIRILTGSLAPEEGFDD